MLERKFDRRVPTDWKHVEKYPLRAALKIGPSGIIALEKVLDAPRQYRDDYDQGWIGACVGFSQSWMMSILNRKLYSAIWLYDQAQLIDEWADTPPEEGTSLRAGFDVLRTKGHRRVYAQHERPEALKEGILENRWATTVDEVRAAIASGIPVNLGIWWYDAFFSPEQRPRLDDNGKEITQFGVKRWDYWIGVNNWGSMAGGHAITCIGASDRRQAFALCNTWGETYPYIVWLPYVSFERLMKEDGEAGIVTDR